MSHLQGLYDEDRYVEHELKITGNQFSNTEEYKKNKELWNTRVMNDLAKIRRKHLKSDSKYSHKCLIMLKTMTAQPQSFGQMSENPRSREPSKVKLCLRPVPSRCRVYCEECEANFLKKNTVFCDKCKFEGCDNVTTDVMTFKGEPAYCYRHMKENKAILKMGCVSDDEDESKEKDGEEDREESDNTDDADDESAEEEPPVSRLLNRKRSQGGKKIAMIKSKKRKSSSRATSEEEELTAKKKIETKRQWLTNQMEELGAEELVKHMD